MSKPFQSITNFEKIFKAYFEVLCNYVNKYINNWDDSREIVQNTFAKIWANKDKIEINTKVPSYLYRSCKNTMIDHIRKNKNNLEFSDDLEGSIIVDSNDSVLDKELVKKTIIEGMETLKPKNREIFRLSKFEGLTHREIAEYLKISERAVEDNISRALKSLKIYLENIEND